MGLDAAGMVSLEAKDEKMERYKCHSRPNELWHLVAVTLVTNMEYASHNLQLRQWGPTVSIPGGYLPVLRTIDAVTPFASETHYV